MLPKSLESAVRTCVKQAFCKKANSRKQMRAFLVKLAADRLQNAYKFAPRGSTTQRMSPVPGTPGREQLLRPSMAKESADGQPAAPKLTSAPAAPKAPAMPSTPAAPKMTPDTQFDLKNMQNSPGTNFFNPSNPAYAAMRGPDPARLAPKPKMRPGMSNEINYGTGPSGESVTADIVPGGTMPVGRALGPTAAERAYDDAYKAKYQDFRARGNPTVSFVGRRAAKAPQIPATLPELAPVPIPEPAQAPPVSTPLPEMPAPESVPTPPSVTPQVTPQITPQVTPQVNPQVLSSFQSPYSQMLEQSKNVPTSIPATDMPNLDPRSLLASLGRQMGQQSFNPNAIYDLFSGLQGGLGNLFANRSATEDNFQF